METYFGASVDVNKKPILIATPNAGDISAHFGDLALDAKNEGHEVMALVANGTDSQRYDHQDEMKRKYEIFDQRFLDLSDNELTTQTSENDHLPRVIAARAKVRGVGSIATFGPEGRGEETHKAMHHAAMAAQKLLAAEGVHLPVLTLCEEGYTVVLPDTAQAAQQALAA